MNLTPNVIVASRRKCCFEAKLSKQTWALQKKSLAHQTATECVFQAFPPKSGSGGQGSCTQGPGFERVHRFRVPQYDRHNRAQLSQDPDPRIHDFGTPGSSCSRQSREAFACYIFVGSGSQQQSHDLEITFVSHHYQSCATCGFCRIPASSRFRDYDLRKLPASRLCCPRPAAGPFNKNILKNAPMTYAQA